MIRCIIVATAMAGWLLATYNKKLRATFQIFRQKNYASMGLDSTHSTRGISTINITSDQPFEMEPKTPVSMFPSLEEREIEEEAKFMT